jgi:hypothetical protein
MAIGDAYATPAELEARVGRVDDGTFAAVLAAASRDLERYCGRQFNKTTTAAARTYHPRHSRSVMVDDFHTVTDLAVATDEGDDGTFEIVWASTDYELRPRGGIVDGVTGWPYERVDAVESRVFPCNGYRPQVQVTAQWGWAAVPAAVREATLSAAEQRLAKSPSPVVGESIDGYSVTYGRVGSDSPFYPLARYRRSTSAFMVA